LSARHKNPSRFHSVSQTKRFKELHISKTSPPEPQISGMSTAKARSARKQGSESELARSAKRNRVEDEFDLDFSKLVTTNNIDSPFFVFVCF
jgi:hypothetical protein